MRSRPVFTPDPPPMEPINSGVDGLLRTTYHTDAVIIETKRDGMSIFRSIVLFVLAGLCEIAGGYCMWLWLRRDYNGWIALLGAVLLVLYGILPTLQPATFGRVYAAYGGVFIVLSVLWGWSVDRIHPDRYELIGACVALVGVGIIMSWPRR